MIQWFLPCQLFLKVAPFLDSISFQSFQIAYSVTAVPDDLARSTFAPVFWVRTRTTSYVTGPLSRKQIDFNLVSTSTTFILPRLRIRYVLHSPFCQIIILRRFITINLSFTIVNHKIEQNKAEYDIASSFEHLLQGYPQEMQKVHAKRTWTIESKNYESVKRRGCYLLSFGRS